jgi:hypothetical protein
MISRDITGKADDVPSMSKPNPMPLNQSNIHSACSIQATTFKRCSGGGFTVKAGQQLELHDGTVGIQIKHPDQIISFRPSHLFFIFFIFS